MPWSQLRDIQRVNSERRAQEEGQPPKDCPIDGGVLDERGGVWHCKFCGYVWPVGSPITRQLNITG